MGHAWEAREILWVAVAGRGAHACLICDTCTCQL